MNTKINQILLILLPFVCAVLSLKGYGSNFKYGVALLCGIILCVAYGRNVKKDVWIIIAAFLFSIVGGWFLSNRKGMNIRFIYGIVFYFIAHLGFLWFSLKNGKIKKWILYSALIVYLVFFILMLYPNIDNQALTIAVLCYLLISCISFAAATGLRWPTFPKWMFVAGIASLLFSDTIIAFKEFLGYQDLYFLMMPTYFLSHLLITSALLLMPSSSQHPRQCPMSNVHKT